MWVKVDDKMHNHRKTRRVISSHPDKRRDAAPMGLWVLAASWAGQNDSHGWVPEDELDRWEDEWEPLASRLVDTGYWFPESRDGEPGYSFVDWEDYNPSHGSSEAGEFGNHIRWHKNRGIVDPECDHCPKEPASPDDEPPSGGDIGGRSGGDIGGESQTVALPDPNPTRTRPEPEPRGASADADDAPKGHTIEHRVTDSAYKRLDKGFDFIKTRGIVKWAIHDKGAEPQSVHDAIIAIYEMGKPIMKQTMGQYLDNRLGNSRPSDRQADILRREAQAAAEADAHLLEIEQ